MGAPRNSGGLGEADAGVDEIDHGQLVERRKRVPLAAIGRSADFGSKYPADDAGAIDNADAMAVFGTAAIDDRVDSGDPVQRDLEPRLLTHLAHYRGVGRLAKLHAAARQRPAAGPAGHLRREPAQEHATAIEEQGVGGEAGALRLHARKQADGRAPSQSVSRPHPAKKSFGGTSFGVTPMKTKLLRGLLVILLGYALFVAAHFTYLEIGGRPDGLVETRSRADFSARYAQLEMPRVEDAVRNFASLQYARARGEAVDQKYEKIGSLAATTSQFDDDERRTRAAVAEVRGLIQDEALSRSGGARSLRLTVGVPPGEFDHAIEVFRTIAHLDDFTVTKNDRTNEYLQLRARRTTLEQARTALIGLKTRGGKIDELVKLEHEILEIEGKIQGLGVQLGQFDQVNELCTVRFTLQERQVVAAGHPHFANLLASLAWASTVYLALLGATAIGLLCLILALVVAQKSKRVLASAE